MNADLILILDAAAFAADRHRLQRRKDADASPCINHPLAFADILAREGAVEDAKVIAAALLHDTVEDILTAITDDLRTSELRGLRWQDIDLTAGRITVCQRSDGFACIGVPKSPAARRAVPIPPEVVSELKRWKLRSPTARRTWHSEQPGNTAISSQHALPHVLYTPGTGRAERAEGGRAGAALRQ